MSYRKISVLVLPLLLAGALPVQAEDSYATAQQEQAAIQNEQSAIQAQITQGITNGTLSADQIAALQARQQALSAGGGQGLAGARSAAARAGIAQPGVPGGETLSPLNYGAGSYGAGGLNGVRPNVAAQTTTGAQPAPTTTRTTTGPDPFTYNTLGPDAYQAQKYQNPGYNVPAYPTTDPQVQGTQQLTSGVSSGVPYGAGQAQAPGAGGSLPQVYSYHTGSGTR